MSDFYYRGFRCSLFISTLVLNVVAHATQTVPSTVVSTDAPKTGPTITVISGDNQIGTPGDFNSKPFDIAVWNAAGTEPLVDISSDFLTYFRASSLPCWEERPEDVTMISSDWVDQRSYRRVEAPAEFTNALSRAESGPRPASTTGNLGGN